LNTAVVLGAMADPAGLDVSDFSDGLESEGAEPPGAGPFIPRAGGVDQGGMAGCESDRGSPAS
jgi:hypothetical protein